MKITAVQAYPLSIPRPQPSWTAHEISTEATLILVEVQTDTGLRGYGEIQSGPLPLVCRLVEQFGEIIRGMDALAHLEVWEKLFALTSPRPGWIRGQDGLPPPLPRGQRPQIMAALGGIDIALWDIKGQAANMPLYQLLGGARQELFTVRHGRLLHRKCPSDGLRRGAGTVCRCRLSGRQTEDRWSVARGGSRAHQSHAGGNWRCAVDA